MHRISSQRVNLTNVHLITCATTLYRYFVIVYIYVFSRWPFLYTVDAGAGALANHSIVACGFGRCYALLRKIVIAIVQIPGFHGMESCSNI